MVTYYSAIMILSIFAMIIIQVSVGTSKTLTKDKKKIFNLLFTVIAFSALCEWLGVLVQGAGASTRVFHIVIKALELSLAPSIGFLISWVIEIRNRKPVAIFLIIHSLIEFASGYFGFIYSVDENSTYSHAEFYWIYILAYIVSIIYFIYISSKNMKRYQYNGIAYFALVVVFMLVGIAIQLVDSKIKVVYVVLSIASIMMYVFTLEMVMQTDKLTELINRRGYENFIPHIDKECAIVFFDIDEFKKANDIYGHSFGDDCIRLTGNAIKKAYARYGKCFRYGGDEFCVVITKNCDNVRLLNESFQAQMSDFRKDEERLPNVSIGYSHYYPDTDNILTVIEQADKMMYENKQKNKSDNENKLNPDTVTD